MIFNNIHQNAYNTTKTISIVIQSLIALQLHKLCVLFEISAKNDYGVVKRNGLIEVVR